MKNMNTELRHYLTHMDRITISQYWL